MDETVRTPARCETLDAGIETLGVQVSENARRALLRYLQTLATWNRSYNLTAVRDIDAMVVRHLLDCLTLLPALQGRRIVDVGSGAGLPGFVIAIARPSLDVTLVESNRKKAAFLRHVKRELAVSNAHIVQSRVEQLQPETRFDSVTTRAYAAVADTIAGTEHLLADNGIYALMKGRDPSDELTNLPAGYRLVNNQQVDVPRLDAERHIVRIGRGLV